MKIKNIMAYMIVMIAEYEINSDDMHVHSPIVKYSGDLQQSKRYVDSLEEGVIGAIYENKGDMELIYEKKNTRIYNKY